MLCVFEAPKLGIELIIASHHNDHHPGGTLGSGCFNFASSLSEDEVRIVGERGHLSFAVFDNGPIHVVMTAAGEEEVIGPFDPPTTPAHVHQSLVEAVVRDLQAFFGRADGRRQWTRADDAAAQCRSTGVSALRASEAMDAVLCEYYGGSRDDAFWARPETWMTGKGKEGGDGTGT